MVVICVCVGLNVQVVEVQVIFGGGVCSVVDFEFFEVLYDVCFVVYLFVLVLLFFVEFDLFVCGVMLIVFDIVYVNLLFGWFVVIVYYDLVYICVKLDDGVFWWCLLGLLVVYLEMVVEFMFFDKWFLFIVLGLVLCFGLWMLVQGIFVWWLLVGEDVCVLFIGVVVYVILLLLLLVLVGVGLMLVMLVYLVGWLILVGGIQVIVDVLIVDLCVYGGWFVVGVEIIEL